MANTNDSPGSLDSLARLERELAIDTDHIESDLIRHSSLYWHAGRGLAYAVSLRDYAKENLDFVRAELDEKVRRDLEEEGGKATEAIVKARIEIEDERIKALDKYLQAKLLSDRWLALKDAYLQRSHALHDIVTLRASAGYTGEVDTK